MAVVGWQQFGPGGTVDTANKNLSKTIAGYGTKKTTAADDTGSLEALYQQYRKQTEPVGMAQLGPVSVPVPMSVLANLGGADKQAIDAMTAAANKLATQPMVGKDSAEAIRKAITAAQDAGMSADVRQLKIDLAAVTAKPVGTAAQQRQAVRDDKLLLSAADAGTLKAIGQGTDAETAELGKLRTIQQTLLAQGDTKTAASISADMDKLRTALGEISANTAAQLDKPYPQSVINVNVDVTAQSVSGRQTTLGNYHGMVAE